LVEYVERQGMKGKGACSVKGQTEEVVCVGFAANGVKERVLRNKK
jgi:hypothetical protein